MILLAQKQQQEKMLKLQQLQQQQQQQQQLEMLNKKKEQMESQISSKIAASLAMEEQNLKNDAKVGGFAPVEDKPLLQQNIPEVQSNLQENAKKLLVIQDQPVKNDKIPANNDKFQGLFANISQVGGLIIKDAISSKQSQGIASSDTQIGVQGSRLNVIGNNNINTSSSEIGLPLSENLHKKLIAEEYLEGTALKPQPKQEIEQPQLDQEPNKKIEDVKSQEETSNVKIISPIARDIDVKDSKSNVVEKEVIKDVSPVILANDSTAETSDKTIPQNNNSQVSALPEKEQTSNKTETAKSESEKSVTTTTTTPTNQTDKPILGNSIFAQPSSRILPQKNSIFSTGSSSLFGNISSSSSLLPGNTKPLDKIQPSAATTEQQQQPTNGQIPADMKSSISSSSQQIPANEQLNSTTSKPEDNTDKSITPKSSLFANISNGAQVPTSNGLFQSSVNKDNNGIVSITSSNNLGLLGSHQAKDVEQPAGLFGGKLPASNSSLNLVEAISNNKSAGMKESAINNVSSSEENALKKQENQIQSKDQNNLILPNIQVTSETNTASSSLFPIAATSGNNINNQPTQKSTSITSIFANNPSKFDGVPSLFSGNNNTTTQSRSLFSNLQGTGLFQASAISVGIQPSTQQQSS